VESSNYAALTASVKLEKMTTPSTEPDKDTTTPSTEPDKDTTTPSTEPDKNTTTPSATQPTTAVAATGIKLNKKSQTVYAGEMVQLTATLTPGGSTGKITWSSSNTKVAKVSTKGKVTALKAGTATITAKLANGKKATFKITVKSKASGYNLTKKTLYIGGSFTWKTTLSKKKSTTSLTFKSSDTSVASVNKNGKITAKKAGTATITAQTSSGRILTCKVTVKAIKATSVKLNATKKTLKKGKTYTLKATVAPKNSTDTLTFTSSNAKVVKVSKSGKLTALKKGTATITVKTSSGKTAKCKVTVK
jgi:uncharacterized protein YjdB